MTRVLLDEDIPIRLQNLPTYDLAIMILRARSKRMTDLLALMPQIERQLRDLRPGMATRIFPDSAAPGTEKA